MPAGDGTGPLGMGRMTGRAAGYCAGFPVPGFMNWGLGRRYWNAPYGRAYAPGVTPYAPATGVRPYAYGLGGGYGPFRGQAFGWFCRGFGRGRGFGQGLGWRRRW